MPRFITIPQRKPVLYMRGPHGRFTPVDGTVLNEDQMWGYVFLVYLMAFLTGYLSAASPTLIGTITDWLYR